MNKKKPAAGSEPEKTAAQPVENELQQLRRRVAELERAAAVQQQEKETLRQKAEAYYSRRGHSLPANGEQADHQRLIHKLEVHQIELQMQNEELRSSHEKLETAQQRYFDLYNQAPVGYLTVDEKGLLLEANFTAAELLGVTRPALVGQQLTHFFFREDQDIYYLQRKQLLKTGTPQGFDLRMLKGDGTIFWAHLAARVVRASEGVPQVRIVVSDISERRQKEEALRESEMNYRALFENSMDGILLTEPSGRIIAANPAACHITGMSEAEIIRGGRAGIMDLSDPRLAPALQERERTGKFLGELTYKRRDGSIFPVELSSVIYPAGEGSSRSHIIFRDISGRKKSEAALQEIDQALRQDRQKLELLFELLPSGISVFDKYSRLIVHNPALEKILGISAEGLTGRDYQKRKYLRGDGTPMPAEEFPSSRVLAGEPMVENVEIGVVTEDGRLTWTEVSAARGPSEDWKVVLSTSDITARKQMDAALRESEEKYRIIFNNNIYAICIFDPHTFRILDVNDAYTRLFGYSREELLGGMSANDVSVEKQASLQSIQTVLTEKNIYTPLRYNRKKDGTLFPVEIVGGLYTWKGQPTAFALIHDISERVLVEEALRESEENYRLLFENMQEGFSLQEIILDGEGRPVDFRTLAANQAYERHTGLKVENVLGKPMGEVNPRQDMQMTEVFSRVAFGGEPLAFEYYSKVANRYLHVHAFSPRRGRYATIFEDITDRKQVEAELRESEEKYRLLFEHMEEGFALHEIILDGQDKPVDFRFLAANQAYGRHTGMQREKIIGKTMLELLPRADPGQITAYGRVALTGEPLQFEYFSNTFNRHLRVHAFSTRPGFFATIFEDVTPRKQAELELKESEEKYRVLFNNELYAVSIIDLQTFRFLDVNEAFARLYGYSRAELMGGLTILDLNTDPGQAVKSFSTTEEDGTVFLPLRHHRRKDGTVFQVEIVGGPYTWKGRRVMFSLTHDISDRLQTETALRESEEKYRVIFNNEIYAICIFDLQTFAYLDVNEAFTRLTGYSRAELLGGMAIGQITAEQQASQEFIQRVKEQGTSFVPLRLFRKKDGTVFPVEIVSGPYFWKGRRVMFALIHDITPRVQAEEEIQTLNRELERRVEERTGELDAANRQLVEVQEAERRALALELHDELGQELNRVKLSLGMAPMLSKEAGQQQYELAIKVVGDLIERVRRMALELRPSVLDEMGLLPSLDWLFQNYREQAGCEVTFTHTGMDRRFPAQVEITAYRFIQEALTNVIRHAQDKRISIRARASKNRLVLEAADRGGGFDPALVLNKAASTGLSGMRERARRLGGELVIKSAPGSGTTLQVSLPIDTGPQPGGLKQDPGK